MTPVGTNAAKFVGGILATASRRQGVVVDIGGVDLYVVIRQFWTEQVSDEDGERIGLLAGGATSAPGTEDIAAAHAPEDAR